jgi:hypothetical protein
MRSVLKRAPLLAMALLVLAGVPASAAVVKVNVPFPFVVKGQQFPAGQYRLQHDDGDASVLFIRGEKPNSPGTFVMTTPAPGKDPAGDQPALTFKRHENEYRLTDIWESGNQGREIVTKK